MLGLTFYSKLEWGCYIISIAKTASKKIGALICSMKFLSPESYEHPTKISRIWNELGVVESSQFKNKIISSLF